MNLRPEVWLYACLVSFSCAGNAQSLPESGGTPDASPSAATAADPYTDDIPEPAPGQAAEPALTDEPAGAREKPQMDMVLVVDNSGSMKKNDPQHLMTRAVTEFIGSLEEGTHLGIVVFDQSVRMPTPLTAISIVSRGRILESVKTIDYSGLYTDSAAAIERAIYELKNNGRPDARKVIVFMTDGIVDTGNPAADLEKTRWLKDDLAPDAAESGIRIFGIAFTENADFQLIQSLAQKSDGDYFRALTAEDLKPTFNKIEEIINRPPPPEEPAASEPGPVVAPPPPPEPIIIRVPAQPAESVQKDDRVRSMIILVSALALAVALIAIIIILVKRSRELGVAEESYAAEAYLKGLQGDQQMYKLGSKPVMLGRVGGQDTDHLDYIVIPQGTIGRRHALIEYKDFAYWITDQGSINGTFVNDKPVTSEMRLKHGDRVRLHKLEFEFVMPEMSDAGVTVLSHTQFSDAGDIAAEEVTRVKGESMATDDAGPDFVLDVSDLEESEAAHSEDEEETLLPASSRSAPGSDKDLDDETLMPAAARDSDTGPDSILDDETLLPGSGTGPADEPEEEGPADEDASGDETLLPQDVAASPKTPESGDSSSAPGKKSSDGEFFDITGGD